MRKALSIFLVLMVLIGLLPVPSTAAEAGPIVTISLYKPDGAVQPNMAFQVNISISSPPGEKAWKKLQVNYNITGGCRVTYAKATFANNTVTAGSTSVVMDSTTAFSNANIRFGFDAGAEPSGTFGFEITRVVCYYHDTGFGFGNVPAAVDFSLDSHTHTWVPETVVAATCQLLSSTTERCTCGESRVTTGTELADHVYGEPVSMVEPTCDSAGSTQLRCATCGFMPTPSSIPAIGHDLHASSESTEATCTSPGVSILECVRESCDYSEQTTIAQLIHNWDSEAWITAPSCTESGIKLQTCSAGGESQQVIVPVAGHAFPQEGVVLGDDCTKERVKTRNCLVCNELQEEMLPAQTAHDLIIEKSAPTCLEPGYEQTSCQNCTINTCVAIPALTHSFSFWATDVLPTCNSAGNSFRVCSRCKEKETRAEPINQDHQWQAWAIGTAPTCTSEGSSYRICNRCDLKQSEIIAKELHSPGPWQVDPGFTCAEGGMRTKVCTVCAAVVQEEAIAAGAHVGPWRTTKEATCAADGISTRTCTSCGTIEEQVIPKLYYHQYPPYYAIALEPSCAREGKAQLVCTVCSHTRTQVLAKLAHTFDDWASPSTSCDQERVETRTCSSCTVQEERVRPAGHHRAGDWTLLKPATCLTGEINIIPCIDCGIEIERMESTPLFHSYSRWILSIEPSCMSLGLSRATCDRCEVESTQVLAKLTHKHDDTKWTTTKLATCQHAGLRSIACDLCGEQAQQVLPQLEHRLSEWDWITEPTCSSEGLQEKMCLLCDQVFTESISLLSHPFSSWQVLTAPECNIPGLDQRSCTSCDIVETRDTKQLYHVYTPPEIHVAPSCEAEGLQSRGCKLCDARFDRVLPATGHQYGAWGPRTYASCSEGGEQMRVCGSCGGQEHRALEPVQHRFSAWSTTAEGTHDCLTPMQQMRECNRCTVAETREYAYAGHNYNKWATITSASCNAEGLKERACTRCGKHESKRLSSLEHQFAAGGGSTQWTDCTQAGTGKATCTNCGELVDRKQYKNHYFARWETIRQATCSEAGEQSRSCRRCTSSQTRVTKLKRHSFGRWRTLPRTDCSVPGEKQRACKACGHEQLQATPSRKHWPSRWKVSIRAQLFKPGELIRTCRRCALVIDSRSYTANKSQFSVPATPLGLSLQTLRPELGDNQHTLIPIDLSVSGEYRYPLIADGTMEIGEVSVLVTADSLLVKTELFDERSELLKAYLRLYPDLDLIKLKTLDSKRKGYELEEKIPIKAVWKEKGVLWMAMRAESIFDRNSKNHPIYDASGKSRYGVPYQQLINYLQVLADRTGH